MAAQMGAGNFLVKPDYPGTVKLVPRNQMSRELPFTPSPKTTFK
jgi:hypothetical protein